MCGCVCLFDFLAKGEERRWMRRVSVVKGVNTMKVGRKVGGRERMFKLTPTWDFNSGKKKEMK